MKLVSESHHGDAKHESGTTTGAQDDFHEGNEFSPQYRGTTADEREMRVLGRIQELRRNFRFISVLGFGCTLIGTWEFILGLIVFSLTDGGTAALIYGYLYVVVCFIMVYLSIAEMTSMAPTSGGQYHWVSEFAPRSSQKVLSYISGYLVATGWQLSIAGTAFLAGTILQGLVVLNYPDYAPTRWQGTLIVCAVAIFSTVFNIFLAKRLPLVETLMLIIYMVGFLAIIIPLWVTAPRASSAYVWTNLSNAGGWPTMGLAVMVGFSGLISSMAGFDCAVHMAEEIKDASETLPNAILYGVGVNGIMGFVMIITICYTLVDLQQILTTDTGYPFIQIFYDATNSLAAANVLTSIVIISFICAVISEIATSSRQLWAFARDGGLPASRWIAKIDARLHIPLNAVIVSTILAMLVSLINIASSTALNAINSIGVSSLLSSYMLTIGCLLWRRIRGDKLPPSRWSLGRWGLPINALALALMTPLFIFCFFPVAIPVDAESMNYGVVMFAGVIAIAALNYVVRGRHVYTPPIAHVKRDATY